MPLEPGGYAEKIGNRYEGRWAVRQLLRLLNEDIATVQIEPLGEDEPGIDLWIERYDSSRQAQQCKYHDGPWTLAELNANGVLRAAKCHLDRSPSYTFALVSTATAPILEQLCNSARDSTGDPEGFYKYQVQEISKDRRDAYQHFCGYLGLDQDVQIDRARAYDYLRRLYFEEWPDNLAHREDLMGFADILVVGDAATVIAELIAFAQDNLRVTITTAMVWKYLTSHSLQPRQLSHDDRILPAIAELRRQFADSIKNDLIAGEIIPRKETVDVLNALGETLNGAPVVVLHGSPGEGKSGVLYEVSQRFQEKNWLVLPVRLDRKEPRNTTQQFGQDLGLPDESPVKCLEAIAGPQPAVLILDQLDAIRWTSRHSLNALDVCKAMVREVRSLQSFGKQIAVILACRTYDLENDPVIKGWLSAETAAEHKLVHIRVGLLGEDVVASVVERLGQTFSAHSKRQKQILQSPQHLAMWVRLVRSGTVPSFQNHVQLMRDFWASRIRELVSWFSVKWKRRLAC